ncbi:MAG: carboxypeptidase-like regulatory domain-containing protein [Planctomycetota bacterium]
MKLNNAVVAACLFGLLCSSNSLTEVSAEDHPMKQWVRLTSDGRLLGEVVWPRQGGMEEMMQDAVVRLVSRDGQVWVAKSSSKGKYTLRDVPPGTYALAAGTDDCAGVAAVHAVSADHVAATAFPRTAVISVAKINRSVLREAIGRYGGRTISNDSKLDPMVNADLDALSKTVASGYTRRVYSSDNSIKGSVFEAGAELDQRKPAKNVNVFVFQNGAEVSRGMTDNTGRFVLENVPPGAHALIAAGTSGVAVIGFEVMEWPTDSGDTLSDRNGDHAHRWVTKQDAGSAPESELEVQLPPAGTGEAAVEELDDDDVDSDLEESVVEDGFASSELSIPPGTSLGGGFGGGSAGGGGAGGLGGIGAAAGMAGIIAAVADDDDDPIVQPVAPVSPAITNQ